METILLPHAHQTDRQRVNCPLPDVQSALNDRPGKFSRIFLSPPFLVQHQHHHQTSKSNPTTIPIPTQHRSSGKEFVRLSTPLAYFANTHPFRRTIQTPHYPQTTHSSLIHGMFLLLSPLLLFPMKTPLHLIHFETQLLVVS